MKLYTEDYRPQYHFSAPKGWLNDPNGLVYYEGEYHLFYQYNPDSIHWDSMHWGHAVSTDLVHWENLPIALYPDENGTCFSGCCVVDEKDCSGLFGGGSGLVALYTGHIDRPGQRPIEHQCVAYSKDKGRTWLKYEGNPVILPPETRDAPDFRDPKVIWHEETQKWVMFLGGGFYRVYTSDDLLHWTLASKSRFFEEFPDIALLPVEGTGEKKWVLNQAGFRYYVGRFDGTRFIREEGPYVADETEGCQATQTFFGVPDGRVVMISWMRDGSRGPTYPWRNNMTVARELKLRRMPDGTHRMVQYPVKELEALRAETLLDADVTVKEPGASALGAIRGDRLEILADLIPSDPEQSIVLSLFADDRQRTDLVLDFANGIAFADYTCGHSPSAHSLTTSMDQNYFLCPEPVKYKATSYDRTPILNKEHVTVHVLIDASTVEIFTEDHLRSYTFNVYPDLTAQGVELTSDAPFTARGLKVYRLKGIWN